VTSVSFTADGRRLSSESADNSVRLWDAVTGEGLKVLQGTIDPTGTGVSPVAFPWRAVVQGLETVVEDAHSSRAVAGLPVTLRDIVTHPSGRTWAGYLGNYLCLFTLEGSA
jgi:WD40 repeat protein